jgi:hypothetical protein
MSVDDLKRKLTGAKGWVKRSADGLVAILEDGGRELRGSTASHFVFSRQLKKFDDAQERYEEGIDDDTVLLEVLDKSGEFRELAAERALQALSEAAGFGEHAKAATGGGSGVSKSDSCKARLPKLELPKFGGDVLEWQTFWESVFCNGRQCRYA